MVGVAIDIGTTTLACRLVELRSGRVIVEGGGANPQARFGADVLSRIKTIEDDALRLDEMRRLVIEACNGLIAGLSDEAGVKKDSIIEVSIAGNSVMEHIFSGVSPVPLAKVPFKPVFLDARRGRAFDEGFSVSRDAALYVFPLIGGFIGGDTVAAALSLGLDGLDKNSLLVDIGTNSEMVLSCGGALFAASAAAGPAFEGGGIRFGMRAEKGAVCGVTISGDRVELDIIGGGAAVRGICGSGLIDAVAGLIKAGAVDKTGRVCAPSEVETNLSARLRIAADGNEFILWRGASGEVTISQADVRSLQTAKAAIRAGVEVLLERAKTGEDGLEVYLAGAFGSGMKKESIAAIGLLSGVLSGRAKAVGDAALLGAAMTLGSEDAKARAENLARRIKHVPLSGSRHFEDAFIKAMNF